MKPIKTISLLLILALLLPVCGCGKSQEDKIDPQYYALGKEMLGLAEAFLDDSISLADAKARAESIESRLNALPLIPKEDPLFDETDRLTVYVVHLCLSFASTSREDRTLALRNELEKYVGTLQSILGLGAKAR